MYFRGEPLKKKKKMDPAIIRAREDRRKRKLEKEIRRLEKFSKQLKQIFECDISPQFQDEKEYVGRNALFLAIFLFPVFPNIFQEKISSPCAAFRGRNREEGTLRKGMVQISSCPTIQ